jgi:hypothetical protein
MNRVTAENAESAEKKVGITDSAASASSAVKEEKGSAKCDA